MSNCKYEGGSGGGGPDYRFLAVEALENINRTLSALSTLIENIAVSLGIEVKAGKNPCSGEQKEQ